VKRSDGRKLGHKTLEELRIRAVERVQAGESPEVVVRALGLSRGVIYKWLALYRTGGWGALKARVIKGRPMTVSPEQMKWIYRTVTGGSPLQHRFEFALWTREMIRILLKERFGLQLSLSSVGRLLTQLGLSCQRPLFRAIEQDAERVKLWLQEEFPRIRALAKREGAEIWFEDEAGVRSDYHSGTTWGEKGQTPVVKRTGQRCAVNMLSAINALGQLRFMVLEGRVNARVFIEFLKRLTYGARRPIFLVVDGSSIHKARLVQEFVHSLNGQLRLFFLPPYSPELNPDEQVWNQVKNRGIGRMFLRNKAQLKSMVQTQLRRLQKLPQLVRAFFQLPDTLYAAKG
jgi:transposase